MKKIVLIVLCIIFIPLANAQRGRGNGEVKWLSLAIKGGYGGTVLLNSDVLSDQNVKVNFLSPSYSYGGRFGITYGDHIGINFEPLFSGFSQEYSIDDGAEPYTKTQKFKSLDYLISLRYISSYGFYFEVGPQFSTLKSATVENSKTGNFMNENSATYMAKFEEKFKSLATGLGFAIVNGDRLQVNLGLRGTYTFGDLDPNYYVLNDGVYRPAITPTSKTNPLTFKLMAEVSYFFGFWGDATCGKGRLMFFQ